MKIRKEQLRQIIKEELGTVLLENNIEQTWKYYEGEIEDLDDLYMWLNEAGSAFKDYKRRADLLGSDGVEKLVATYNIKFPITSLQKALQIYEIARKMTS